MNDAWENENTREYLGDGVYVAFDGYAIMLRIGDHRNFSSEIVLDPYVMNALKQFHAKMENAE